MALPLSSYPKLGFTDKEAYYLCPFDDTHVILAKRWVTHIEKCIVNHPSQSLYLSHLVHVLISHVDMSSACYLLVLFMFRDGHEKV